jgi:hypothetical protein
MGVQRSQWISFSTAFENLTMGDKLALCLAIQVIKEMGFFVLSLHLENYRVEENS